ncbi:hypothetical protein IAE16_05930 [Hydrogenobacter sp. T-2]|uniref:hypothetical protein n=1 Tax=Pampinifervens diazotrophicum TaxID=1632018 RepID=UPI002B257D20|nr:hypothetical protein [Hydrogenobacter sp. T-2]WPM31359.1 hypothetical protein IAE16_05930 [Hydrogenobacter sp. T-2]
MAEREELKEESLEEQVEELRKDMFKLFEVLLPPKEVRREVMKNLYTMELSFWKIIKTIVDYEVQRLESRVEGREKKEKVKRIQVE